MLFINKIWGGTTPFFEPRLTDNCSLQTLYACCLQYDPPQIPSMSYISSWVIRYTKVNPPTRFNKHNLVQKSCAMCQKCLSFQFWANTRNSKLLSATLWNREHYLGLKNEFLPYSFETVYLLYGKQQQYGILVAQKCSFFK